MKLKQLKDFKNAVKLSETATPVPGAGIRGCKTSSHLRRHRVETGHIDESLLLVDNRRTIPAKNRAVVGQYAANRLRRICSWPTNDRHFDFDPY